MTCIDGAMMLDFAAGERAALASSALGGLLEGETVADLFCGAGGWGDGLASVGIRTDFAVNHDATAIDFHFKNHPACVHHQGDAWRTKPREVVGRAKVGLLLASAACTTHSRARGSAPVSKRVHMLGTCILRWMKDVRPRVVIVENVAEWMDWGPLVAKVEVGGGRSEVQKDAQGRVVFVHDPARKGEKWKWWLRQARRLGYALDYKVLDAADFGSASRRRRLFVILRNDGAPIVWPERTHARIADAGGSAPRHPPGTPPQSHTATTEVCDGTMQREDSDAGYGSGGQRRDGQRRDAGRGGGDSGSRLGGAVGAEPRHLQRHRAAAEIIDWSDLGTSIFDRKKPLADKTLGRICEGIRRFVLNDPRPFLLRVTQTGGEGGRGGWKVSDSAAPMPTQTTRQDLAVATPVVAVCAHGEGAGATKRWGRGARSVEEPLGTLHAGGISFGMATPILATTGYGEREGQAARVHRVAELLGTCVNGSKQGVCTPVLMNNTTHHTGGRVDGSVPTVTTGGQSGLVAPVLSHFRHGGAQNTDVRSLLPTPMANGNHAGIVVPVFGSAGADAGTDAERGGASHLDGCAISGAGPEACSKTRGASGNHRPPLRGEGREMDVAALFVKFYGNESGGADPRASLGTCTTKDRHGVVCCAIDGEPFVIVDILFRMLRPRELAAAMGFRASYIWPSSQRDATRLIGNAVSPPMARALVGAVFPRGRQDGAREAVAA